MKNNSGVTLIALVIIVILLLIFTSAAVYTSINSYKLIDLQKYKTQMQAIQSAVDEFYEEFENMYSKHERELEELTVTDKEDNTKTINLVNNKIDFMKYYIKYRWCLEKELKYKYKDEHDTSIESEVSDNTNIIQFIKGVYEYSDYVEKDGYLRNCYENPPTGNEWWNNVANSLFEISINDENIKKQYYYLTKNQIKEFLGVKDIDISENFIINFEKRYVFSENSIDVDYEGRDSDDPLKKVYCLYQFNEEEKVIEFKAENTGGTLDVDIIEKTLDYQTIRIKLSGQETTIKKVYFQETGKEPVLVEENKDVVQEVIGLETSEVLIKIKKDGSYSFLAEDLLGGFYPNRSTTDIRLHNQPVLESNMIPFETIDNEKGRIFYDDGKTNLNSWYDYTYGTEVTDIYKKIKKYATVVLTNDTLTPENKGQEFEITQGHIVKVWIPKNLYQNGTIGGFRYIKNSNFINKTGVWVAAKWDNTLNKWVPDLDYNPYRNTALFEFDGTKIKEGDNELIDSSHNKYTFKNNGGVTFDHVNKCMTFNGQNGGGLISNQEISFGNKITVEIVFQSEFKRKFISFRC